MKHRPKALLELNGVPLLARQLTALAAAGMERVVVVLGHHAEQLRPLVERFPVKVIAHPQPEVDQQASLRLGLATLDPTCHAVLVALVDQPLLEAADFQELISTYTTRPKGSEVVQPCVAGQPGNPVIFSAAVRDAILAAEAGFGCRHWQQAYPEKVHRWDTPNTHYSTDVDTEDDIEEFARRTGHRLVWPVGV